LKALYQLLFLKLVSFLVIFYTFFLALYEHSPLTISDTGHNEQT